MSEGKPRAALPLGTIPGIASLHRVGSPLDQSIRSFLKGGTPSAPAQAATRADIGPLLASAARARIAGELAQASNLVRTALRLAPNDAAACLELAHVEVASGRVHEAIRAFRHVAGIQPGCFEAWRGLGAALDSLGDAGGAIEAYRRALDLSPRAADMARRLSVLLTEAGRTEEAIACLNRAADAQPRTLDGHLARARALMLSRRYADSEQEARKAVARAPRNARALMFLGELSGLLGRFDEARACFRRIIEDDEQDAAAYFNLVHVGRITEAERPVLRRIELLLERTGLSDDARMRLCFALGKAYDDLNEPAKAIAAFDAANALRSRLFPLNRAAYEAFAGWLVREFSAAALARYAGRGNTDERPVFILGLPRSGTTLIEQIVSSHPEVAAGDELPFWPGQGGRWQTAASPEEAHALLATLAADYSALLSGISAQALRVTDKNPFNFFWIGLISLAFPRARFIHCRRHPIATCLSIYMTHFTTRADYAGSRSNLVFYYRLYEAVMAHWRRVISPERLLEVDYEDLVAAREREARRMIEFCELDWNEACLAPERNQRAVQTASVWQARQPIYTRSIERWRRYEPWLGDLRSLDPG